MQDAMVILFGLALEYVARVRPQVIVYSNAVAVV